MGVQLNHRHYDGNCGREAHGRRAEEAARRRAELMAPVVEAERRAKISANNGRRADRDDSGKFPGSSEEVRARDLAAAQTGYSRDALAKVAKVRSTRAARATSATLHLRGLQDRAGGLPVSDRETSCSCRILTT